MRKLWGQREISPRGALGKASAAEACELITRKIEGEVGVKTRRGRDRKFTGLIPTRDWQQQHCREWDM